MEEAVEPAVSTVRKKKTTSAVYDYFDKVNETTFKCKICGEERKKHSTTNLWTHLYPHQPQTSPADIAKLQTELESWIGDLFFTHRLPFRLIESPEFRALIKCLFPSFRHISRHRLTNALLPEKVNEVMTPLLQGARRSEYLAITTDECSRIVGSKFLTLLSLSAHYIDEDWEYKEVVVATKQLKGPKNADNISKKVSEICDHNGLVPSAACTDSAAVMGRVMQLLNILGVYCIAHRIHLCVKAAITKTVKIYSIVRKCRRIAKFLNKSSNGREYLTQRMDNHGLEVRSIKSDTKNRWNSTFFMMTSIMQSVLEICLHATNRVCRRTSTASLIIPILSSTIMRVDAIIKKGKMKTESKLFTNYLLSELKRRRDQYLTERPELLFMSLLDSRFAYHPILFMNDVKSDKKWQRIEEDFIDEFENENTNDQQESSHDEQEQLNKETVDSFWGNYESSVNTSAHTAQTLREELTNYKAIIKSRPRGDPDTVLPFSFWKDKEKDYPILSRIARRLLSIPATSTTSERIFSVVANITQNRQRNPMGVDNTEQTLLITANQNGGLRFKRLKISQDDASDSDSLSGTSSDSNDSNSEVETGIEDGLDSSDEEDNIDQDDGSDHSLVQSDDESSDDDIATKSRSTKRRGGGSAQTSPSKRRKKP